MHDPPPFVATDYDPLLVTSPTIRSGTTLLQRLLCSSPRALVYGELCGQDLTLTLNIYASRVMLLSQQKEHFRQTMGEVLAGRVNDWILDLTPDVDEYLAALGQSSLSWIGFCRDHARKAGRPVWGFKSPGMTPPFLQLLRRIMPASRVLYIHRDAADCVRSAKAMRWITSVDEVRTLCQEWVANLRYILSLGDDPRVLLVSFADLLAEPDQCLERIAAFSGAHGMDRQVLRHKINTYVSGAGGHQEKESYVLPEELGDEDKQIIDATTTDLRQQLYGKWVSE